jgi:hypothetical protein
MNRYRPEPESVRDQLFVSLFLPRIDVLKHRLRSLFELPSHVVLAPQFFSRFIYFRMYAGQSLA